MHLRQKIDLVWMTCGHGTHRMQAMSTAEESLRVLKNQRGSDDGGTILLMRM
jgi:hypothetical protein